MLKKHLSLSNAFFLIAFTFSVFSFTLGKSVITSYQKRLERYDTHTNKTITFQNIDKYTVDQLQLLLKDENITITLQKFIDTTDLYKGFMASTQLITNSHKNIEPELKDGTSLTQEDYSSEDNITLVSTSLYTDDFFKFETSSNLSYELDVKGTFYSQVKEIYIPYELFFTLSMDENIAQNTYVIVISGDESSLNKSLAKLNTNIKSIDSKANIVISDYFIDNRSKEGSMLIKSTIIIILITIITSIAISKLWIKNKSKELVMRIVCGATKSDIFKLFYSELLILSTISYFIALSLQLVFGNMIGRLILNMNINLDLSNIILSAILSICVAFLASIPSLRYIYNIQPINLLREE